ncbi:hypothetical protein BS47DRAFT_1392940 [Hydnum rufescens UP504]|uniref:Uncharacterized protein n=1 Tax=Hydnum rufescens UP504 TaxID=1448309 RepID=A0A9P6DXH6_9AGAM|nr:hypothetical protein BS47DRAFT_1392940 [Hydnum rufescens UP504]
MYVVTRASASSRDPDAYSAGTELTVLPTQPSTAPTFFQRKDLPLRGSFSVDTEETVYHRRPVTSPFQELMPSAVGYGKEHYPCHPGPECILFMIDPNAEDKISLIAVLPPPPSTIFHVNLADCQRRNVSKQQYRCLVLSGHERGKRSLISPTQLAAYTSSATADNNADSSARRPTAPGTDP